MADAPEWDIAEQARIAKESFDRRPQWERDLFRGLEMPGEPSDMGIQK